jgi:apolipoprotein N-acyltransferase
LSLGSAQIDAPLGTWLPVVGALGAGGLAAVVAGCLACVLRGSIPARLLGVSLLLVLLASGMAWHGKSWTERMGEPVSVAVIQGNIPQDQKWLPEQRDATLSLYREMTLGTPRADLVVWPETAVPALRFQVLPFLDRMAEALAGRGSELIYGVATYEPREGELYNSVGVVGDPSETYHKHHLVPFGEYLPLRSLLSFFKDYVEIPMSDFSAGPAEQPALRVGELAVGVSVCYEAAFGEQIRSGLPEAELLVNVSNDAWFGTSLAPHQHLEIARVRAAETGRAMLRATNTGISAIVDHRGRLLGATRQFEATVLEGEVARRSGSTPYVRHGQLPVIGFAVFLLLAAAAHRCFRRGDLVTRRPHRIPD